MHIKLLRNKLNTLLGRAEASPTQIMYSRKLLYLSLYDCMYLCSDMSSKCSSRSCTLRAATNCNEIKFDKTMCVLLLERGAAIEIVCDKASIWMATKVFLPALGSLAEYIWSSRSELRQVFDHASSIKSPYLPNRLCHSLINQRKGNGKMQAKALASEIHVLLLRSLEQNQP